MQTLMIEVRNDKAMALLRDLENLDLIKVIEGDHVKVNQENKADHEVSELKLSQKLRGSITLVEGEQLQREIQEGREEWNRNS